ncbi:hypothetical protein VSX64_19875 [Aurantimonas sp. C2-6-R+9]|uniref:hypothetical protein n=1 Tax=unclassified Aurantimonas TaxID=2638230 RepID=UPI002E197A85|nr:hypothetical protein [Aurantimonas sp. C2-6-R+9]
MIDEGGIGRLSALVERAAAEAEDTGREPSVPKQATRRKVSRRKLLDDLARAESRYHEAKARHDALHHAGRGLTFEQAQQCVDSAEALLRRAEATLDREWAIDASLPANMRHDALEEARLARDHAAAALDGFKLMADVLSPESHTLRTGAIAKLDEAADGLRRAFADALPPGPKKRKSKSPRVLTSRDSRPVDIDRFKRWLRYRADEFDAFRDHDEIAPSDSAEGVNPAALALGSGVPVERIEHWIQVVRGDEEPSGRRLPTKQQMRECMGYCADHLGYFEPGLAAVNRLVQHLFVVMEQRGISNEGLARATCLSARTIEAWGGNDPRRSPRLQDVLACYQELNLPLAPVSYEADRAFQNHAAEALIGSRTR